MADEDITVDFGVYMERTGANGSENTYEKLHDLPSAYVMKLDMVHSLDYEASPMTPTYDGERPPPEIIANGVKDKSIQFSCTFKDCAYVMDESPPITMIPEGLILHVESDFATQCPEFDDDAGYWRIKSVNWGVDSKSMLWRADVATTYVWINKKESMFFE